MMRETSPLILLFPNFTNTHDESPRQLTQAKYVAIQSQTVCRCKKVKSLWHSQKHVFTLCVTLSLILRVKDSLPEGTMAAALVVEATEENTSESDLWVISWKRLLLQKIGENELVNPELEELDQLSRYQVKSIFA